MLFLGTAFEPRKKGVAGESARAVESFIFFINFIKEYYLKLLKKSRKSGEKPFSKHNHSRSKCINGSFLTHIFLIQTSSDILDGLFNPSRR
jgi:hypothetical protein